MPEIENLSLKQEPESLAPPESPLAAIEARNRALIDEIHALGADVPPMLLIHLQLDVLVELVFPSNTMLREVYNYEVEGRLTAILEEYKSAVLRKKLEV
jgi:hypothetical protein